jgi:fumarylpyruvate hydrolase
METVVLKYVIPPPELVTLPIHESEELFPVRRVYCIGRNYAAHAIEMGHDPNRDKPFFFQKNSDNLDISGKFLYPNNSNDVHFEAELAIILKSGGSNITTEEALNHVLGYSISIDMTRRDLQTIQKKMGRPWEIGKAFERSAPIGLVYLASKTGHLSEGAISLKVNGEIKQQGNLNQMIWKVPEIISYLSDYFKLAGGDVILSGTPSGVGAIVTGDLMEVTIDGLDTLSVEVI